MAAPEPEIIILETVEPLGPVAGEDLAIGLILTVGADGLIYKARSSQDVIFGVCAAPVSEGGLVAVQTNMGGFAFVQVAWPLT